MSLATFNEFRSLAPAPSLGSVVRSFTREELLVVGEVAVNRYAALGTLPHGTAAAQLLGEGLLRQVGGFVELSPLGRGVYTIMVERAAALLNAEPLHPGSPVPLFEAY